MSLSDDNRSLLQSQLILAGEYNATVDGQFGPSTYAAITGFQETLGEQPTGVLSRQASAALDSKAAEIFALLGMDIVDDFRGQFTMVVPAGVLTQREETRRGNAYFDPENLVRLETINKPYADESYLSLYQTLLTENANRSITYNTFNNERFVVSGIRSGLPFYIYMYATPSASVGFSMEWDPEYQSLAGMIAIFTASHSYPRAFSAEPPVSPAPTPEHGVGGTGYGTGFFVAENGILVTNHHVIDGCSVITVPTFGRATVVTSNADIDLAVLRLTSPVDHAVARIRAEAAVLGEAVTIIGYPLPDVMASSLSVGTGIVSSLTGLAGEPRWFTTNVGMQPGNSGGPILDELGQVVGVAVARIDDVALLASTGVVAPNFGFAIKNDALLEYLEIFKLADTAAPRKPLSTRDAVQQAQAFTVQVVCELGN